MQCSFLTNRSRNTQQQGARLRWNSTSLFVFVDMFLFVSAMSLKEAGKLLESKVYDTLQLQVNNLHVRFVYFVLLKKPNSFKGSELTTLKHFSLDSEDDFCSGCRNVSHQQQFLSELHTPGWLHNTNYWYAWVQTIYYVWIMKARTIITHDTSILKLY